MAHRTRPLKSIVETIGSAVGLKNLAEGVDALASGKIALGAFNIFLALPISREGEAAFASEKLLASHFEKHGAEFGLKTAAEYLGAARKFFSGEGTETVMRGTDRLFYNEAKNEFGVLSKDGTIRTFFKPTEGRAYWERVTKNLK